MKNINEMSPKELRALADSKEAEFRVREAYDKVREMRGTVSRLMRLLQDQTFFMGLHNELKAIQWALAQKLGATVRLEIMTRAGMDEEYANIGRESLTDDDAMFQRLATWLFDRVGRWYDALEAELTEEEQAVVERVRQYCSPAVEYWIQGRHDT